MGLTIYTGGKPIPSHKQVDLIIVFDTTGSMDSKIEALISQVQKFIDYPKKFGLEPSFTLISFGDLFVSGDKISIELSNTEQVEAIKQALANMKRNAGGGNGGESSFEAILETQKIGFRKDAIKVIILITDEPAHESNITYQQIQSYLQTRNFVFYAIATSDWYYQKLAEQNAGQWELISAKSSLNMLNKLFEKLAKDIATRADEIFRLASGDPNTFKSLPPKI